MTHRDYIDNMLDCAVQSATGIRDAISYNREYACGYTCDDVVIVMSQDIAQYIVSLRYDECSAQHYNGMNVDEDKIYYCGFRVYVVTDRFVSLYISAALTNSLSTPVFMSICPYIIHKNGMSDTMCHYQLSEGVRGPSSQLQVDFKLEVCEYTMFAAKWLIGEANYGGILFDQGWDTEEIKKFLDEFRIIS